RGPNGCFFVALTGTNQENRPMTVLGFLIGKSRLAEVVAICKTLKVGLENPDNVDVMFGVRLADFDVPKLEALHYDWASSCDRRMFVVVGADDVAVIDR